MWRSTDRAILEKKPSTRLSHEPCFGVNTKVKRPSGWAASHFSVSLEVWAEWLSRISFDGGVRWIRGVEFLEQTDELPRAMAIFDAGVNLAREQVDPGEQAQRAMALVFVITRPTRTRPGLRRQVGGGAAIAWMPGFSS